MTIQFKRNDIVKYRFCNRWYIGFVTIVSWQGIKIMFDDELVYDYYPPSEIWLATDEDLRIREVEIADQT